MSREQVICGVDGAGSERVRKEQVIYDLDGADESALEGLLGPLARWRQEGKTIVSTNGCFDLLHPGHVHFLEEAASLGDVLVVGLNSDASIARLKGSGRPILDQAARATILAALRPVDYVVIFDDMLPMRLLEQIRPDIHCKAADYTAASLPEASVVERHGGRIAILPLAGGYSTTALIGRAAASLREEGR